MSDTSMGETIDVTSDARVLFDAVRHGKTHLVRFILEAASSDIVNARDLHGKTPLMTCCCTKEERSRDEMVKLLIRLGADINLSDDFGRTVLSYVCEKRCNDILRILVKEHNIDPDIMDNKGNSALMYSAIAGNDIACDILVRHFRRLGLNIDQVNVEGFTALLLAAKHGNMTCAQILVGQGKAPIRQHDRKYGLSVEQWLEKKGFALEDIEPVRKDGRGRSRFVRIVNVATLCKETKKAPTTDQVRAISRDFMSKAVLDQDDDELDADETSTAPGNRDANFNSLGSDVGRRYKVYPLSTHPALLQQENQTLQSPDEESVDTQDTELSGPYRCKSPGQKRWSLPEIGVTSQTKPGSGRSNMRQTSIDVLPEVLTADLDLGDGRHKSIKLHADTRNNRFYWKPDEEDVETIDYLTTQADEEDSS